MAITETAIDMIADIGIEAVKERLGLRMEKAKARKEVSDYLRRQEKHSFNCSPNEEIDFEGLMKYIRSDLMDDAKLRLFGKKQERKAARKTIADKAAYYAHAKTRLSEERARHLAVAAVDILSDFFRNKVNRNSLFVAAEIEDAIISEMADQCQNLENKMDALGEEIHSRALLSIDKNVSLANAGQLQEVEKNISALFAALDVRHELYPYYGFTMECGSHLKSCPKRPDAVELHPPHLKITATAPKLDGIPLANIDASTFARAYRTQSSIEFDVAAAEKYLGKVLDPIQAEAQNLIGTHMVLNPPAFPPAFSCSVRIDGETVVDYLLLRTRKIEEDGTTIITNDEQKNFRFGVMLAIDEERTKFVLSITPKDPSNAEMLHYKRFLKKAASAKRIELKSLEYNEIFISSKSSLIPHDCENLDLEIEILQKVVAIEEYFHVTLTIPNKIEANDREVIHRLYSMITEGKYCGSCSGFTISFDLTEKWRRFICDFGEKICGFLNSMDMSAELFHQKLDFKITRMVDSMRLKNFEKTMQKLNADTDHSAKGGSANPRCGRRLSCSAH